MSQKCCPFCVFFFTNEMECEKGKQDFSNKVIVLNATSVVIFQYQNARKTTKNTIQLVYFNEYKGKSTKEIADMFSLKIRTVYNTISRAEKEGRRDLKGFTNRQQRKEN